MGPKYILVGDSRGHMAAFAMGGEMMLEFDTGEHKVAGNGIIAIA